MFITITHYISTTYIIFILYINTLFAINIYVYLYKSFCIFMHRYSMQHFLTLNLKYINILKRI